MREIEAQMLGDAPSDPECFTCGLRMFRSAAFIRCVALWLCMLRARRWASATVATPVADMQIFLCDDAVSGQPADGIPPSAKTTLFQL